MEIREEYGLFFQMNCATVLHPRGIRERIFVKKMLSAQAIDLIATDAHDTQRRPVCMKAAYEKLMISTESAIRVGWFSLGKGSETGRKHRVNEHGKRCG